MVNIRKNLMPSSLYNWKSPYSMTPTRIVVHNTANDASADNEIKYMNKSKAQGGVQTSFHYAVDDKEIVQGLPENRNAWHAGDGNGKGNREGIAIEICYSKSGGDRFIKAEQNAVDLIVDILKRYNWDISKVTKHQDYMNKYCPHRTLDMGWDRFLNMIKAKMGQSTAPSSVPKTTIKISDIQSGYNSKWSSKLGKIDVDNIYGPDTKKHLVKALQYELNTQFKAGLSVDGIFGSKTKNAFVNVRKGAVGNITWLIQAMLYAKGYNPNGLDGQFYDGMYKCVVQYQEDNKLSADGIVGKNTGYKLFA